MLLKIRVHGPKEKPSHSCKAVVATVCHDLHTINYSDKYRAWNVCDTDETDETKIDPTDYFIGWVYMEEIFWQIVLARREAGDETE